MPMQAIVVAEIKNGTPQDAQWLRSALNELGLWDLRANAQGELVRFPEGAFLGEFPTEPPARLRTTLFKQVNGLMVARNLQGRLFIAVGEGLTGLAADEDLDSLEW